MNSSIEHHHTACYENVCEAAVFSSREYLKVFNDLWCTCVYLKAHCVEVTRYHLDCVDMSIK